MEFESSSTPGNEVTGVVCACVHVRELPSDEDQSWNGVQVRIIRETGAVASTSLGSVRTPNSASLNRTLSSGVS